MSVAHLDSDGRFVPGDRCPTPEGPSKNFWHDLGEKPPLISEAEKKKVKKMLEIRERKTAKLAEMISVHADGIATFPRPPMSLMQMWRREQMRMRMKREKEKEEREMKEMKGEMEGEEEDKMEDEENKKNGLNRVEGEKGEKGESCDGGEHEGKE